MRTLIDIIQYFDGANNFCNVFSDAATVLSELPNFPHYFMNTSAVSSFLLLQVS